MDIAKLPSGLTADEAAARLKRCGPNTITTKRHFAGLRAFAARFTNPLVIILVLAAGLSFFVGDHVSSAIIIAIITVSVLLDFINTFRSEKAADALKNRIRLEATVRRDGHEVNVPTSELVVGDIVVLMVGSIIPADGKIISADGLFANESTLTGESFPQEKRTDAVVFMGTSVASGQGLIEITATGPATKFNHIAVALDKAAGTTEFDHEIRDFSLLVVKITSFLVIFIFAVNIFFQHNLLDSLLFSLALAVGLTPELLPLIITLNLTKGSLEMARHGVIVKRLSAIQNFGSMDVLCTDKTGTLTEDRIVLVRSVDGQGTDSKEVYRYAYLTSTLTVGYDSPLDRAVRKFRKLDISDVALLHELPFDFERRRESIVVKQGSRTELITMGAPEGIMTISAQYLGQSLTPVIRHQLQQEYDELSSQGFRVLALATRELIKKAPFTLDLESDLNFAGFIAFLDPAKSSAGRTIAQLHDYGIETKIITGDNALVSQRIAQDINLEVKGVISGDELDKLSDTQLALKLPMTTIFARSSPEQKLRIIKLLQSRGHVVGYIGDGINDAPALKAADVGISVNNAVDVAKDSADLILLHKSLGDLALGVIEGRRTFANTLKYLMMGLGSNFGNMFSMAGASLLLPFLPLMATQILFVNLLYDTSQFALPLDNVDPDSLKRPRKLSLDGIKRFMYVFGPLSSIFDFATFGLLYLGFHYGAHSFQSGWFIESVVTQTLVIYIVRTKRIPFLQSWPGKALLVSTLMTVAIGIFAVLGPFRSIFKFGAIGPLALASIGAIVVLYLVMAELTKRVFYRYNHQLL